MQRISVTTLEKFRRYINSVSPYDTEAALLETLQGLFTGNDKTKFGGAFHKVIEDGQKCFTWFNRRPGYLADGVFFTMDQGDRAMIYRLSHPQMVHEMVVGKVYETNYFPIQVSGRVDGTEGMAVRDAKTKFKDSSNLREYSDSYQWRYYLDIMETDIFYYDLFEVHGFKEFEIIDGIAVVSPDVRIVSHDPFQCIAYENMNRDIICLLNEFLEYLHHRKYLHFLKPANLEPEIL